MFDRAAWARRLAEMRGILESDRRYLLSGQIGKLSGQDQRRSVIEAKLHQMPDAIARAETAKIEQIKRLAQRNHRLLQAYLDGARRATRKLVAMEENQGRIGAYRRDGTRVASTSQRSTKQQRA